MQEVLLDSVLASDIQHGEHNILGNLFILIQQIKELKVSLKNSVKEDYKMKRQSEVSADKDTFRYCGTQNNKCQFNQHPEDFSTSVVMDAFEEREPFCLQDFYLHLSFIGNSLYKLSFHKKILTMWTFLRLQKHVFLTTGFLIKLSFMPHLYAIA